MLPHFFEIFSQKAMSVPPLLNSVLFGHLEKNGSYISFDIKGQIVSISIFPSSGYEISLGKTLTSPHPTPSHTVLRIKPTC